MAKKATEEGGEVQAQADAPPEAPKGFHGGTVPRVAFRCRRCGHLVPSAHAGECQAPRSCPVCKAGVTFLADGNRTYQPEVWEVLADATPERLEELGLTAEGVEEHAPAPKEHSVRAGLETCKEGLAFHEAKRRDWEANKEAAVAEFQKLDARYLELGGQLDAAEDPGDIALLSDERDRVRQRLQALADSEPSPRDAEHEAHLKTRLAEHEAYLAGHGKGAEARPQTLRARLRDGGRAGDRP